MKVTLLPLVALSFLCASPAPATAVDTTDTKPAKVAVDSGLRQRFCDACDELARKAAARGATREDYNRVANALRDMANAYIQEHKRIEHIQQQLLERLDELMNRAKLAELKAMEFDVLKDKIIDIQLLGCLARATNRVAEGKMTPLEWTMLYESLTLRAQYAKDFDPEIEAIVAKLNEQCVCLEKRAKEAIAGGKPLSTPEIEAVWVKYWDVEARASADRLGRRTLQQKLPDVPQDYKEILDVLVDSAVPIEDVLYKKVQGQLDVYRDAVRGGRITRAEFQALCDLLCQRARAALGPQKT